MMNKKNRTHKDSAEKTVRDIRRATRRNYAAEEKIRIILEGLRGEDSIAELCRKEGINQNLYYRWSKEFLEAGKKRLSGDVVREATSDEVKDLRQEALGLKEVVAELLKRFKINPLWLFGESDQKHLDTSKTSVIPKVVTVDNSDNDNMVMVNAKAAAGYPQNISDTTRFYL